MTRQDSRKLTVHPLLRPAINDWRARSGADSALPDAPVAPDPPKARPADRRPGSLLDRLPRLGRSPNTDPA